MANIPGLFYTLPGVGYAAPSLNEPQDYVFIYNDTTLTIKIDGDVIIDGNARDAAKALFNHVLGILEEFGDDKRFMRNNNHNFDLKFNKIIISLDKPISLIYPYQEGRIAPENFLLLKMEFDKLIRLMVFI